MCYLGIHLYRRRVIKKLSLKCPSATYTCLFSCIFSIFFNLNFIVFLIVYSVALNFLSLEETDKSFKSNINIIILHQLLSNLCRGDLSALYQPFNFSAQAMRVAFMNAEVVRGQDSEPAGCAI